MLNIYVGKDNLPRDKQFIFDVESIFPGVTITGTNVQRYVISDIEKGEYVDNKRFKDRFGGLLYYTDMSTGSKAIMVVDFFKDYIINCDECGENALGLMSLLDAGNVFLSRRSIGLPWIRDCEVCYNGKCFPRISLLNDWEW